MRAARTLVSLTVIGAAILGGAYVLEASASTSRGGKVELFSKPSMNGATGSVLIAGAIGDHGRYDQVNKTGTPDPNGRYLKISLHHGTIKVRFTAATVLRKTPFKATCSGIFSERTPSVVLNGTGQYAGISGALKFTATHVLLSSRHTSGPDAGQCNHADIISEYNSIGATGTVRLG